MSGERYRPSRWELFKLGARAAASLAGLPLLGGEASAQQEERSGRRRNGVTPGVQVLLEDRPEVVAGKRFGLITNPTGILPDLRHEVDASTGTHDGLSARVLAFESDETEWVLAVLDLIGLDRETVERLASTVQERTGLPPQSLTLVCTHTHSGPQTLGYRIPGMPPLAERYLEDLAEALADAVGHARARRSPVPSLGWAEGSVCGVAANRRRPPRDEVLAPISVLRLGGVLLFGFACHPTVLGHENRRISADLFGAAARQCEETLGRPCVPLQGTAGDVSTRYTRRGQGFAEVGRLGGLLADAVRDLDSGILEQWPIDGLDRTSKTLTLPRKSPAPEDARREVLRRERALIRLQERPAVSPTEARLAQTAFEGALAEQALAETPTGERGIRLFAARLGPVAFATIPGEPFSELGERIRARSPFPLTLIIGYADGYEGYLPTAEEHETGGYEAAASPFAPGAGEMAVDAVLDLLATLHDRRPTATQP